MQMRSSLLASLLLLLCSHATAAGAVLSTAALQRKLHGTRATGNWRSALQLLEELAERGEPPSTKAHNNAAIACSRAGEWARALSLLDALRANGGSWDDHSFTVAVTALGKRRQWQAALNLLDEMDEPNEYVYGAAIGACAVSARWAEALELLDKMADGGVPPTTRCFNGALAACERAEKPEVVAWLFDEMRNSGEEAAAPSVVSYGTALAALGRRPSVDASEEAVALLAQMEGAGLDPSTECYGAAAMAHSASGAWEHALQLLDTMERRGVTPNGKTLCNVLNACAAPWSAPNASKAALALLRGMESRYGVPPDKACVNAAIKACARGGEWRTTLELLAGLGAQADARSYVGTLAGLGFHARWKEALFVMGRMRDAGHAPNLRAYTAALTACAAAARWREALKLYAELLAEEPALRIDAVSVSKAVEACAKAGEWRAGLCVLEDLVTQQREPKVASFENAARERAAGIWREEKQEEEGGDDGGEGDGEGEEGGDGDGEGGGDAFFFVRGQRGGAAVSTVAAMAVDGSAAAPLTPRQLNAQLNRGCTLHDELRRTGTLADEISLNAVIVICEKWGLGEPLCTLLEGLRDEAGRGQQEELA